MAKTKRAKRTNAVEKTTLERDAPKYMTKSERLLHQAIVRLFVEGEELELEDVKKGWREKRNADMIRLYKRGYDLEKIASQYYPLYDGCFGERHPRYDHFISLTASIIQEELRREGADD